MVHWWLRQEGAVIHEYFRSISNWTLTAVIPRKNNSMSGEIGLT